VRLGVVTDIHHDRAPDPDRRWINRFETEAVLGRLEAALDRFRA
jgi:hypothetical protein